MSIVLIVAEQQPDGNLRKASLNAIAAGKQLADKAGGELHLVLLSKDPSKLAGELAGTGAKAVHTAAAPEFEHYLAEVFAPVVASLAPVPEPPPPVAPEPPFPPFPVLPPSPPPELALDDESHADSASTEVASTNPRNEARIVRGYRTSAPLATAPGAHRPQPVDR